MPILLLLRRQLCDFILPAETAAYDIVCNDNFLTYLLALLAPWKAARPRTGAWLTHGQALFSIEPMNGGWWAAADAQFVLGCTLLLAGSVGLLVLLAPRLTQAYM